MKIEKNPFFKITRLASSLFLASLLFIIIGGATSLIPTVTIYGVTYGTLGAFSILAHAFIGKVFLEWVLISCFIFLLDVVGIILLLAHVITKEKKDFVLPIVADFIFIAYFAYLLTLATSQVERGISTPLGNIFTYFAMALDIASIVIVSRTLFALKEGEFCLDTPIRFAPSSSLKEKEIRDIIQKEIAAVSKSIIGEEEIRNVIRSEMAVNNKHSITEEEIRSIIKNEIEAKSKNTISILEVREVIKNEIEANRKDALTVEDIRNAIKSELEANRNIFEPNPRSASTKEDRAPNVSTITINPNQFNGDAFLKEIDDKGIDRFAKFGARRKLSFERKLLESDESLKKHYNGLREYIIDYGINCRVSLKGVTFSLHRKRYVFLTISGKHIRAFFALNPKDYLESTIPAKENGKKKYEDLPLELNIRSGLSYRRALQLIDDMMLKKK